MTTDSGNMTKVLAKFPYMLKEAMDYGKKIKFENVDNIVVVGMGGSGYNGDLLKVYLYDQPLNIHVVKNYTLPKFADNKTLVFAVSYSGNTEETVAAYRTAIKRCCKVVSIASGGKLEELAKMNKNPHIAIPKGIQPRLSTLYQFVGMLNVLVNSGLVMDQTTIYNDTIASLKQSSQRIEENGKDLAKKLHGVTPIIYSSQKLFCIAEKWKTDINENAKTHAFYNMFSEFNHNEICAYENPVGNFHIVIVSDQDDHPRIKKRIKIFKELVSKDYDTPVQEIAITGDNYLTRLVSSVWMGLYLAYYLALEYDIDPTPVKIIESLKKDLK